MDKTTGLDYRKPERNPAEIRSDIEETRAHLGETVEEIKERFSSEHVKSQMKDATLGRAKGAMKTTAEKAREFSATALETVKKDPLPYLSIGAGLGMGIGGLFWLLSHRQKNGHGYSYDYGEELASSKEFQPTGARYSEGVAEAFEEEPGAMKDLAQKTQEKARRAKEQAGMALDRAKEKAGMALDRAKEKTGELRELAVGRSREWKSQMDHSVDRNPFVLGSLFFALGSAIGFLFPSMAGPLVEKVGTLDVGGPAGGNLEEENTSHEEQAEMRPATSEIMGSTHSDIESTEGFSSHNPGVHEEG